MNNFKELTGINDLACLYKWGWSTIFLHNMTTNSCHRCNNDDVDIENFENFHNTEKKIKARQLMLNGIWPKGGCEYCQAIENAGGISDRIDINNKFHIKDYIPVELLKNNKSVSVSPTMVEVYFSNLCNLGCIYCSPKYSSVLEEEAKKFKIYNEHEFNRMVPLDTSKYSKILEKFWKWLEFNAKNIKKYNILGGEPFYQPELIKNIEFFESNPCPNLSLTIFSNLKVNQDKFKNILNRLSSLIERKHLETVSITCSLDCWGEEQEYVRYGINLVNWEKNYRLLALEFPMIKTEVHGTMTSLTIKTISELIRKINEINMIRMKTYPKSHPLYYTNNLAYDPSYLSPGIFPKGFFDLEFNELINEFKSNYEKEVFEGYKNTINNIPYNPDMIKILKNKLDENDSRRGTSWRKTFPWLDEFYE